uniref:Lipase domain-containing protein n=1 Tax=Phlebotomus papatasi TaxID=29031 RepID=A0A1B0DPG4_PHLPP
MFLFPSISLWSILVISLMAQSVESNVNRCVENSALRNSEYASNIFFKYYDSRGNLYRITTIQNHESRFLLRDLHRNQKYAIIVPGWRETCELEWVFDLVRNLISHRGGTILCMDYTIYSAESYFRLVRHFDAIAEVLTRKLCDLELIGLPPAVGFLFGFSYGGQLVSEAGRRVGPGRIKEIDSRFPIPLRRPSLIFFLFLVCDMAGPGFESKTPPNHSLAAENVQCIHTSRDKGIRYSTCHQDWKMGNCGFTQDAAGKPPLGSHGLCPYFYNIAFKYDFFAIPRPTVCASKSSGIAGAYPTGYKMGYLENRKG